MITAEPVAIPLLERFTAVYVQDSSTIVLPEVFAAQWHGCGGSTSSSASAALKLQARMEMRTGRLDVQLQEGRASDRAAVLPGPLPAGALRLADLGYWSLEAFAALAHHQVFWLSRLQIQTAVYDATGARQELLTLLESQPTDTVERAVALGERQRLAARLLAVRVPQDVAETRRRRLRKAARDKGRPVSATRLALAAWTMFVTNVPPERLTLREALVLGRLRWQIELLFKLWKSHPLEGSRQEAILLPSTTFDSFPVVFRSAHSTPAWPSPTHPCFHARGVSSNAPHQSPIRIKAA